jgi:hypothetical protein
MTNLCTVTRQTGEGSINEQGVYTNTGDTIYEGPCLVRPADRDVRQVTFEEQRKSVHIYNVQFPKNTPVEVGDVVVVTKATDSALLGRSLVVRDVLFDEWQISREAVCEELR